MELSKKLLQAKSLTTGRALLSEGMEQGVMLNLATTETLISFGKAVPVTEIPVPETEALETRTGDTLDFHQLIAKDLPSSEAKKCLQLLDKHSNCFAKNDLETGFVHKPLTTWLLRMHNRFANSRISAHRNEGN